MRWHINPFSDAADVLADLRFVLELQRQQERRQ
jgi:hypothetical protein